MSEEMKGCCCMADQDENALAEVSCEASCEKKEECKKCGFACRIIKPLFLIGVGFLIGVHFRAIKAMLKGEPLPKAPAWHCWIKKSK